MKSAILIATALPLLFASSVFAAEHPDQKDAKDLGLQIQAKNAELDLRAREMKLEFEKQMQQLELERKKMEIEGQRNRWHGDDGKGGAGGLVAIFLIGCFVVNILAAIWVYLDIRARNAGSGIWIVITLIAGLFGALIYALARLGDVKREGETGA